MDRPIGEPDQVSDAIRWPVVKPDRDVRSFQDVLLQLGALLELPGMVDDEKKPLFKDYSDYMQRHQRRPGIGPLAGYRGDNNLESGRGDSSPNQIEKYVKNGGFWSEKIPENAQYCKPWNEAYQKWAVKKGFFDKEEPFVFQIYLEPLANL